MTTKRLYRPRNERMIAGVCAGIGNYLNIDPTLVRLAVLLLAVWGGGGILAYIIAWIVIPEEPLVSPATDLMPASPAPTASASPMTPDAPEPPSEQS